MFRQYVAPMKPILKGTPDDVEILGWLEAHGLPPDCLQPIKDWIELCRKGDTNVGQGFAVDIASIAANGYFIDLPVAMELAEKMAAYSEYG